VVPFNPAATVRGPKHVVKTGTTTVLDAPEWRKLIDATPTDTVRNPRDDCHAHLFLRASLRC